MWVEINFKQATKQDDPGQTEFVGVLRDVTERKRMEDELNLLNRLLTQLAATDGLTGLTNRRTFDAFLRREYEACEEISVLLFDIDHFKGYNDTYGHQAGDRCLQAVAKVIGDATSNTPGLSARYGGEEFAVVLPNTSEQGAMKVAEAIRLTVRALGLPTPPPAAATSPSAPALQPEPARRSARPRWSERRTPPSTKPSVSAGTAASPIRRWNCNLSTPHRSSPIRSLRQKSNSAFSNFLPIREAIHTHNLPVALSRDSPWMGAEAWRSQMTAIARALSRAFTTAADVEVLKQLLLFAWPACSCRC